MKKKKILSKITAENMKMLSEKEKNDKSMLEKLLAWQEDYNDIDWEKFKGYTKCNRCDYYSDTECLCWAR